MAVVPGPPHSRDRATAKPTTKSLPGSWNDPSKVEPGRPCVDNSRLACTTTTCPTVSLLALPSDASSDYSTQELLREVAPYLEAVALDHVVTAAMDASRPWRRAEILTCIAAQLSGALLDRVLQSAIVIGDNDAYARCLESLSVGVGGAEIRGRAIESAFRAAAAIPEPMDRGSAVGTLAPHLSPALLAEALDVACSLPVSDLVTKEYSPRFRALRHLAPCLRDAPLDRAVHEASSFLESRTDLESLSEYKRRHSDGVATEAAEVFAAVAAVLTGGKQRKLVAEALQTVLPIAVRLGSKAAAGRLGATSRPKRSVSCRAGRTRALFGTEIGRDGRAGAAALREAASGRLGDRCGISRRRMG